MELPRPASVDSAGDALDRMAIHYVYSLKGSVREEGTPLHESMDLGRFQRNLVEARSFGLRAVAPATALTEDSVLSCDTHGPVPIALRRIRMVKDRLANVHLAFTAVVDDPATVPAVLACTCFDRDRLVVDGRPIIQALRDDPAIGEATGSAYTGFAIDVHTVVSTPRLPTGSDLTDAVRIVYRETARTPNLATPVIRPDELNRFEGQLGVHGRGVTVLVGHDAAVVEACTLIVHNTLFILQRLRSLERRAAALLAAAADIASSSSASAAQGSRDVERLSALAREAQELEVSLGFDVETAFASAALPEILLDSYRTSLAGVLGIARAIAASASTIARVRTFISAGFERLASQREDERTDRERTRVRWAALISAVVVPTALLLSLFSLNTRDIPPTVSAFSAQYLLVWLAYVVTVVVGLSAVSWLTRRKGD
jgi:hypothetical protein